MCGCGYGVGMVESVYRNGVGRMYDFLKRIIVMR